MKLKFLSVLAISAALLLNSCDRDEFDFSPAPSTSLIKGGTVEVVTDGNARYHVLNFGGRWTSTIVESEKEITIVDVGINDPGGAVITADISKSGEEIRAYANAINKPITIIITHPHVDHFINLDKFKDITVYAETKNAAALNRDATFKQIYGKDAIAVSGSRVIGGFEFHFGNVSGTEATENGYVYIPSQKAVFTGDLTAVNRHSYIRDYTPLDNVDELSTWINALKEMKTKFSDYRYVFVGHVGYDSNVSGNFDKTIAYLSDAQGLIKGTKNLRSGVKAKSNKEVVDELKALYPSFGDGGLLFSLPNAFFPGDPGAIWFK
ncbi:MBL fold metallo-hydrolase [Runella zeae]|uniref:MBL fold metallo-hydrolase n=1 Tax=Runella zeae TaxID=94255 RepID=UPI00048A459B|nr:MBL fold metallo-hydrolase [Runella zeae]